jgi:hypothetical protein
MKFDINRSAVSGSVLYNLSLLRGRFFFLDVAATIVVATHANDFHSSRNFFAVGAAIFVLSRRDAGTDRIRALPWVRHNFPPHTFSRLAAHHPSKLDARNRQIVSMEIGFIVLSGLASSCCEVDCA